MSCRYNGLNKLVFKVWHNIIAIASIANSESWNRILRNPPVFAGALDRRFPRARGNFIETI